MFVRFVEREAGDAKEMRKKGSWFSALKRIVKSNSKENTTGGYDNKYSKEKKKWRFGKSKKEDVNLFISSRREPSSIEKILEDAQREEENRARQVSLQQGMRVPPREHPPNKNPPETRLEPPNEEGSSKKGLQLPVIHKCAQIAAIKIQAAYRGYLARKSHRSSKGLLRLQCVMRGQSVKSQTMNAMRCMQVLVRVQSHIRTRRLQMIETRSNQRRHSGSKSDKGIESSTWKWKVKSGELHGLWEDSTLTKDELDARMMRKIEAVNKRERALSYAYSHQNSLLKVMPRSSHGLLFDVRSRGYTWWWKWIERQFDPGTSFHKIPLAVHDAGIHNTAQRSQMLISSTTGEGPNIFSRRWPVLDTGSLTRCPVFTVPTYAVPTLSTKAKTRDFLPSVHFVSMDSTVSLPEGYMGRKMPFK